MSESLPKVSIILPTYNGARYIEQSIDSCLNQTYTNIELIIVDDNSKDETAKIINSYNDKRIKYIRHKNNEGLPTALNTGFAYSTGQYLTWTSDDNQYLPTAIEEMASLLAKNKAVDMVYTDYWVRYLETGDEELRKMPSVLNLAKGNNMGACFLYTRRVYEAVGNYNPKYKLVEDYDYWIRISKRFNVMHYPKPLYVYGEHSKSLTNTRYNEMILFAAILKYKAGYISISELRESFFSSFYRTNYDAQNIDTGSKASISVKSFLLYLRNTIEISRISLNLCIFCLLLLIRLLASSTLRRLITPYESAKFFFSVNLKNSRLKIDAEKKNILCIVPHLVYGGFGKVLLNIAEITDREKYSFHIITTLPANNVWQDKFKKHFQNILIPADGNKYHNYSNALYCKFFVQLIKKLKVDIILVSHSVVGYDCLARLKDKFPYVKVVDLLHNEVYPPFHLIARTAPYVDKRICISNQLRSYTVKSYKRYGVLEKYVERIAVIHNGVDTKEYRANIQTKGKFKSQYAIPKNLKLISFIGRFSDEKNPLLFVDIGKSVLAQLPNEVHFVMAGDGLDFEKVKDAIRNKGLDKNFTVTGRIDSVTDLLNDTDILLVVSKMEGVPIVVLEAMSMGVPIISTDVGAINEVIDNQINGFLINANDNVIENFTHQILELMQRFNAKALAEKSRETAVLKFSLETMGSKYQRVFDGLTQEQ